MRFDTLLTEEARSRSENVVDSCSSRVVRSVLILIHLGCAYFCEPSSSLLAVSLTCTRSASMVAKPFRNLVFVNSAESLALCRVTVALRPCLAGSAMPFFESKRSCVKTSANVGDSCREVRFNFHAGPQQSGRRFEKTPKTTSRDQQTYLSLKLENTTLLHHLGQNAAPFCRLAGQSEQSLPVAFPAFLAEDLGLQRCAAFVDGIEDAGGLVI